MTWLVGSLLVAGAMASEPEQQAPQLVDGLTARVELEAHTAWRVPMPRSGRSQASSELPPVREVGDRHRSRNLLLGALGAEVVAAALLGGAAATRTAYLDDASPTKAQYRTNRILGHAGYASAVAGGAMVLGSISMWEW